MIYYKNQEELKNKILNEDIVLKAYSGSNFYGTNTPESDTDYIGIYMVPKQILFGMEKMDEISLDTNPGNTKNTNQDEDIKYYSIKKFFQIACKNGPNAVEILFTPEDKVLKKSAVWDKISSNYELFVSQLVFNSMFGYALSQRNLSRTKRDRYLSIEKGANFLEELLDKGLTRLEDENIIKLKEITSNYVNKSGRPREYLNRQPIEQVLQNFKDEMNRYGHRAKYAMSHATNEYRYDWKFASHSIRLLVQCIELAETGKLTFPLKQAPLILDVKQGKFTIDEVEKLFDDLDDDFNKKKKNTPLQKNPRYHEINNFLIEINENYFK